MFLENVLFLFRPSSEFESFAIGKLSRKRGAWQKKAGFTCLFRPPSFLDYESLIANLLKFGAKLYKRLAKKMSGTFIRKVAKVPCST